jgi:hypothetical protein
MIVVLIMGADLRHRIRSPYPGHEQGSTEVVRATQSVRSGTVEIS